MFPNFSIMNCREKIIIFLFLKNFFFKFVIKKLILLKLKPNYKNFQTNFVSTLP